MTVDGRAIPVFHDYAFADPDAMRTPGAGAKAAWAETVFIIENAGRRGVALWQIDTYSRIGGEGDPTSDPFGFFCENIAQEILEAFSGLKANGVQRGKFPVLDYADPNNPTDTGMCLWLQNANGDIGEPDEKRRLDFADDFRRVTMTLRFRTIQDSAGKAAFYVD